MGAQIKSSLGQQRRCSTLDGNIVHVLLLYEGKTYLILPAKVYDFEIPRKMKKVIKGSPRTVSNSTVI